MAEERDARHTCCPTPRCCKHGISRCPREINARVMHPRAHLARGCHCYGGVACCVANALAPSFSFITHWVSLLNAAPNRLLSGAPNEREELYLDDSQVFSRHSGSKKFWIFFNLTYEIYIWKVYYIFKSIFYILNIFVYYICIIYNIYVYIICTIFFFEWL